MPLLDRVKEAFYERRRYSLLFFALLYTTIGQSYYTTPITTPAARDNLYTHLQMMPLTTWGLLWIAAGIGCLAGAVVKTLQPYAFGVASAVMGTWAMCFGINQFLGHGYRGYVAFVIYTAFAAFILLISGWPEESDLDAYRQ